MWRDTFMKNGFSAPSCWYKVCGCIERGWNSGLSDASRLGRQVSTPMTTEVSLVNRLEFVVMINVVISHPP